MALIKRDTIVCIKYEYIEIIQYRAADNIFLVKNLNGNERFLLNAYISPFEAFREYEYWIPEAARYNGKVGHNVELTVNKGGVKYRVKVHTDWEDGIYWLHPVDSTNGINQSISKQADLKLSDSQFGSLYNGESYLGMEIYGKVTSLERKSKQGGSRPLIAIDTSVELINKVFVTMIDQNGNYFWLPAKHLKLHNV